MVGLLYHHLLAISYGNIQGLGYLPVCFRIWLLCVHIWRGPLLRYAVLALLTGFPLVQE